MPTQVKRTIFISFSVFILCGLVFTVSILAYQEYAGIEVSPQPIAQKAPEDLKPTIQQHTVFILLCIGLIGFIGVRRRIDPGNQKSARQRQCDPAIVDKTKACGYQLN